MAVRPVVQTLPGDETTGDTLWFTTVQLVSQHFAKN